MSDEAELSIKNSETLSDLAKPLHIQRLEHLLRLDPFLHYVEKHQTLITDDEISDSDSDINLPNFSSNDCKVVNGVVTTHCERKADRIRVYNLSKIRKNRKWLKNLLLSESSSDEDDDVSEERFRQMLKFHLVKKNYQNEYHNDNELQQYQYYSAGLLSNTDKFAEHQRSFSATRKRNRNKDRKSDKKSKSSKLKKKSMKHEDNSSFDPENSSSNLLNESTNLDDLSPPSSVLAGDDHSRGQSPISASHHTPTHRHKREKKPVTEATLNMRRRRLWIAICKKEVGRAQKQKVSAHKEVLTMCKKLAQGCVKESRKEALLSQKTQKDTPSRCKRLSREMLLYWKKFEKVEKEHRKKAEKEAQEQLKMDIELREAKRQQRKLNFLITQTELYAHFMSRKITGEKDSHKDEILNQLDEKPEDNRRLVNDDYDCDLVKGEVEKNAEEAYNQHILKTQTFDVSNVTSELNENLRLAEPNLSADEERPQPKMFVGMLKSYQLKGMNWLFQLYNNGINGILADEMGLGKTVQSISFLAHVAETLGIWGPFLVIAPASTLHNWQQEFTRFVPKMKVLPYWGNAGDRKTIRKFWSEKDLHTEQASFHVLITSYQLVIQDVKYFQRIKWQYMILDEAQAIKSASSVRWKLLLGFNCRNRLLLTGTPIQNSMAELWALLHFIMPTMFDSHQEFNEWFSKDIESHAENRSVIDEKHLSRLHMILKPFMLRRIKKDVENELSDKIEILKYCALTSRQKHLYRGLKNKISIEDLFNSSSASVSSSQAHLATSSLMNLVIQFRKVCNHPELFERREVKSPFHMVLPDYVMTKFFYRNGIVEDLEPSKRKLLINTFGIFHPDHIHSSFNDTNNSSSFSFLKFIDMSPAELSHIMLCGFLVRWLAVYLHMKMAYTISHATNWNSFNNPRHLLLLCSRRTTSAPNVASSLVLKNLIFTSYTSSFHSFVDYTVHRMKETKNHYHIRVKHSASVLQQKETSSLFIKNSRIYHCSATDVPDFLLETVPKVVANPVQCMCSDADAVFKSARHLKCGSEQALISLLYGHRDTARECHTSRLFFPSKPGGLVGSMPPDGWSRIVVLDKEMLVTDSGKLKVLDELLTNLKEQGHRVLIYSQMTRMIDILEEYMWHRKHTYIRLDGSSKISDRRDMVADFQSRSDIFVFLLSTRAGGLGINLTAADTVIFYDSDWNPTVDQQAMDRAHRLGQTKQVTVYRLICKGTIEERILQRAREKSEIQRMVISGGNFKPDTLKPKEVVSLLLDDDEMESKLKLRQEERRAEESGEKKRKRKDGGNEPKVKRKRKKDAGDAIALTAASLDVELNVGDSGPSSPYSFEQKSPGSFTGNQDEMSNDAILFVDDAPSSSQNWPNSSPSSSSSFGGSASQVSVNSSTQKPKSRRGRPKGSTNRNSSTNSNGASSNSTSRGRSAMSAAEIAGAQAGRSAAYAAYGYQLSAHGGQSSPLQHGSATPPSMTSSPSRPPSSLSRSRRGGGAIAKSSSPKSAFDNLASKPSMGFYTQNE